MSTIIKTLSLCVVFLMTIEYTHAQNALNFDGTNDRVNCGNTTNVQISGTAITLEAWIKPTAFQNEVWKNNIIDKETWTPQQGYMLRCGAGGKLNFNLGSNSSWNELTSSTTVLTLDTWQHVAATYDGSYMRIYVDGVCTDSVAKSISFVDASSSNLVIGDNSQAGRNFSGSIDEVRIWNVARTKDEINAAMNDEICAGQTGLLAYYRFNEGTANGNNSGVTSAINSAINGTNATLSGFALTDTVSNWVNGVTLTPSLSYTADTVFGSFCSGSSFSFAGQNYNTGGLHMVNLYTTTGCDSIVPLQLTQLQGVVYSYRDTICQGFSLDFNGQTLTTPGTYSATLTGTNGCDSLVYLVLAYRTFNKGILKSTDGTTLTSKQGGVNYQWLDCDNNFVPVSGATSRVFSPTAKGNYCVVMDKGGCSDTSICVNVDQIISISNAQNTDDIRIYPNPSKGITHIVMKGLEGQKRIEIFDLQGRSIFQTTTHKTQIELNLSTFTSGTYLLNIQSNNSTIMNKIYIQ